MRSNHRSRQTAVASDAAKCYAAAQETSAMSDKRKLNVYSRNITEPKSQGASQAMLYGTGLTAEDMHKPQVGVASVWYEGNTCNMHLLDLAAEVKRGVQQAGLVGFRFNTI